MSWTTGGSWSHKFAPVIECLRNVCQAPNDAQAIVRELILLMRDQQRPEDSHVTSKTISSCDWRADHPIPDFQPMGDCVIDPDSGHQIQVQDSDEAERLALKFDPKIASIWQTSSFSVLQPDVQSDIWGQAASIWSFNPSAMVTETAAPVAPDENQTSLMNHTPDSLFVQPLSSVLSCAPLKSPIRDQKPASKTLSRTESLLTSAATHFQPIRNDFYERAGNIVTDASVCGLVPCSGKCPNHIRNRSEQRKEDEQQRPASPSMNELALFVGPFSGDENDRPVVSADKGTNTSDDAMDEADSFAKSPVVVDDYDAICSILNDVLNRRNEDDEQLNEETVTRTAATVKRTSVPFFESLFVDPEASGYRETDLLSDLMSGGRSRRLFDPLVDPEDDSASERRFLQQEASFERGLRRSPAPQTRHFVIEPKIGESDTNCCLLLLTDVHYSFFRTLCGVSKAVQLLFGR